MPLKAMLIVMSILCLSINLASAANTSIGYLELIVPQPPVLSNLEDIPEDEGLAGARVGLADNLTTGKFLGHTYALEESIVAEGGDYITAAKKLLESNAFLLLNLPKDALLKVADLPEAQSAILFNVASPDIELRSDACRANLLHTAPSRAMLSDALAQFALKKRWSKWALIHGIHSGDKAYLSALETSAKKFGLEIVAKKEWAFDADMRRNAAQEVPLFTQDMDDHDLLIIADEIGDFGRYVIYNTWIPRPAAGSEGIMPSAWSASVEQHGAAQLQSRFEKSAMRKMRPVDYGAWAALRTIGEAVTRTNSADVETIRDYILSDKFELGGFKGRPLTFRTWNGQMRQPIPLSHSRAVVATAPLEGFLHQRNELDTLGLDKSETTCSAFTE